MIIKRIATALRRQDWATVLIEFFLVISGILIALQIDNWNEEKKASIEQTQLLNRLANDLTLDKAFFTSELEFYSAYVTELTEKRDLLFKEDLSNDEIFQIFPFVGAYIRDLNPRRTTFDEMINSGKLYQIDNLELVNAINDYYQLLDLYIYNDRQTRNEFRALFFGPALTEYWFWIVHPEKEKFAIEFFNNRNSISFKSLMQAAGWSVAITNSSIAQYKNLIEANNKIVKAISAELNK